MAQPGASEGKKANETALQRDIERIAVEARDQRSMEEMAGKDVEAAERWQAKTW